MKAVEFVKETVCSLDQETFEKCREMLLREYIPFSIIDCEAVNSDILAEKLCDIFDTMERLLFKDFNKFIATFINELDELIEPGIASAPQAKKGDKTPVVIPRARKYYQKAIRIKDVEEPDFEQIIDYSRIMFCLYTAEKINEGTPIFNFEFSADCLDPEQIIEAMKNEEKSGVLSRSKKKCFNTKELYSKDTCTMIISVLLVWSLINRRVQGAADHE